MKKASVFGALLIAVLFGPLPALATIQVTLENPANGTSASGLTIISGWAFSDSGAAVTVLLRVNGKTTETTVLCCGPRQDVQEAHPAAPLNSGFGLLWNYGVLPSGVHTVGRRSQRRGRGAGHCGQQRQRGETGRCRVSRVALNRQRHGRHTRRHHRHYRSRGNSNGRLPQSKQT